ncbi:MAG: coproporphyrinogen III oxidase [Cryobacterium sp.]|nr:coproporphyrinogen III oxidase [Cryobacterium sp.]MBX3104242.1 coproporphyrinogen III oxidase [Cryobacterium sp.]
MPSVLPVGDTAPEDGLLPESARENTGRKFGIYVHVPFCRVRCGYCDFNTYTATELRGVKQTDYPDQAIAEIRFAKRVLEDSGIENRQASTVFFGGGTPTLLPASELGRILEVIRSEFGLREGAEITTEANPDSVSEAGLNELQRAGFTRVSFGMQSAVPSVLLTLDRTHNPAQIPNVVNWARRAGLDISLDLIYGAPRETIAEWRVSLESAIALEPDHLSAYALIVEAGTRLERQIRLGEVPAPDDDLMADKYELADSMLSSAGFEWYEISNWAKSPDHQSRHNLGYWTGEDWWGIGPGAHSHVGNVRWWNVKHPAAFAARVLSGVSPAHSRETLDSDTTKLERILLESRMSSGLDVNILESENRVRVAELIADELVDAKAAIGGTVKLTLKGRLLADAVVRALAFS